MKNLMNGASANHPSLFGDDVKFERISYAYKGNRIEFRLNGSLMVNASEMAKPFGENKKPSQWLRYDPSKEFMTALIKVRKNTLTENQPNNTYKSYYGGLVVTQRGGVNPGTWMHEDVALEFARWLSPEFAIWCNDRIKEILTGRKVMVDKDIVEYVGSKLKQVAENVRKCNRDYAVKYGFNSECMSMDMTYGCFWDERSDLKSNLDNLIACFNNNTLGGFIQLNRARKMEQECDLMRKFLQSASRDIYEKFKIYPN